MDCAEGTFGQIMDYCVDKEKLDAVMLKTRIVYISHIHGDHNLGLIRFLKERDDCLLTVSEQLRTKVFVIVP